MYNRQIVTFIQSVDCGSFTKAAEALYTTTASVMKQINALESRVGTPLFKRTPKGLIITAAGASLYKDALSIIQSSEEAIDRARVLAGNQQITLHVGTSILNPCHAFIDVWRQIEQKYPHFKLQIVPFSDTSSGIEAALDKLGREIDFVVGTRRSSTWRSLCNFFPLGEYPVTCIVPQKHRLASKSILKLPDLYGENLMIGNDGDMDSVHSIFQYLEENHPKIKVHHLKSYDIDTFNTCVQTGYLLLAVDCWANAHPSVVNIPILWPYTTQYGILYSKVIPFKVKKLLEVLEAERETWVLQKA